MAVRLRLVHPVPTRIAPGTSPPCSGVLPFVRRTPRAQPDKRSPSCTRFAVSPLLPHRANAISSPPAPPYPAPKALSNLRARSCGAASRSTCGRPTGPPDPDGRARSAPPDRTACSTAEADAGCPPRGRIRPLGLLAGARTHPSSLDRRPDRCRPAVRSGFHPRHTSVPVPAVMSGVYGNCRRADLGRAGPDGWQGHTSGPDWSAAGRLIPHRTPCLHK